MIFERWLASSTLALTVALCAALPTPPAMASDSHTGGTLRLIGSTASGTLDPQINYTLNYWSVFYVTNDGLVGFKKANGAGSFDIVADLATEVPKPQDGGKTYVFTLRRGIKFSTGKEVTPNDVVASFRRVFKVISPSNGSYFNLVGADKCIAAPAACTLDGGITADEANNTVTFHLAQPDSDFISQLATIFGTVLPADTPAKDLGNTPAAATGPYMIESYDPQKQLVLIRNPYFKVWSMAAQPAGYVDRIVYSFGLRIEDAVTEIENNQADWMYDAPSTDRLPEMSSKYASQIHISPFFELYYATMNVNIPPFNNREARLAVNYAINRRATVSIAGGPRLAVPTCQILPPGFPGYVSYCPYTQNPDTSWSAPDLTKAMELMKKSGLVGQQVTVIVGDGDVYPALGTYLLSVLNQIGFKASLKVISSDLQSTYVKNTKNNVQITINYWVPDYPAPSAFLKALLGCGAFHVGSDASNNVSGFCDKSIDADMDSAMITAITNPAEANKKWAAVDHKIVDQAPWAVLYATKGLDFVSKNLQNFFYSYEYRMVFSQVWVN